MRLNGKIGSLRPPSSMRANQHVFQSVPEKYWKRYSYGNFLEDFSTMAVSQ